MHENMRCARLTDEPASFVKLEISSFVWSTPRVCFWGRLSLTWLNVLISVILMMLLATSLTNRNKAVILSLTERLTITKRRTESWMRPSNPWLWTLGRFYLTINVFSTWTWRTQWSYIDFIIGEEILLRRNDTVRRTKTRQKDKSCNKSTDVKHLCPKLEHSDCTFLLLPYYPVTRPFGFSMITGVTLSTILYTANRTRE